MGLVADDKLPQAHGRIHVLCVGANEYSVGSGFAPLKVCAEDARRVAQTFGEVKELNADPLQVRLLVSGENGSQAPTGGHIHSALHHLAASASSADRILFFFSGHGSRVDNELYLIPEDGNSDHTKYLISFKDVLEILGKSEAKQKLIVLDSCFSGPTVTHYKSPLSTASQKFLTGYLDKTVGTAIIGSSTADQPSSTLSPDPKVSLFTHFFVTALRGNPAAMDGKLLTLDSLFNFVSVNVIKTSKSHGKNQQPTIKQGGTGVMVLGDFSHPLLSAAASELVPAVDHLSFHDRRGGDANDVLTELKFYSRHQPQYIENLVNAEISTAYKESFGKTRAKLFTLFDVGQVKLTGDGIKFPGGSYSVRYEADDVRRGAYIYTARFDSDWLNRTEQMLGILKLVGVTNPDVIEFEVAGTLDPEACLPKLQSSGWTVTSATEDSVEAELEGYTLRLQPGTIELTGFVPPDLFGRDDEMDDSALLVTGLIKRLAAG